MGRDDDDRNPLPRYCSWDDPKDHHPIAPAFRRKVLPIFRAHYGGIGATASKPPGDRATRSRTPNVVSGTRYLQRRCRGIFYECWYPVERSFRTTRSGARCRVPLSLSLLVAIFISPLRSRNRPRPVALKNIRNLSRHTARIPPVDPAPAIIIAVLAMHPGHIFSSSALLFRAMVRGRRLG